jgi:hypothetical protein
MSSQEALGQSNPNTTLWSYSHTFKNATESHINFRRLELQYHRLQPAFLVTELSYNVPHRLLIPNIRRRHNRVVSNGHRLYMSDIQLDTSSPPGNQVAAGLLDVPASKDQQGEWDNSSRELAGLLVQGRYFR